MKYEDISLKTDVIIKDEFAIHPFSQGITSSNVESVLSQYFAMSQAFPYLQAGSQKALILDAIKNNTDHE